MSKQSSISTPVYEIWCSDIQLCSVKCGEVFIIIIIINKVLIKATLNKVIAGALYIVICGWNAVKVLGWQLTVEDDWNRDVFKRRRKHSSDGVSLTAAGRLFHARDAATGLVHPFRGGETWKSHPLQKVFGNSVPILSWFGSCTSPFWCSCKKCWALISTD